MATGGPVRTLTINGRPFAVTADADVNVKLGGFEKERAANGDGTTRALLTPVPWMASDVAVSCSTFNNDQEFLQDIANDPDDVPISVAYANGDIYTGVGSIEGELQYSTANATATFGLSGTGVLGRGV